MSLVEHGNGAVSLSNDEARQLTDRIKVGVEAVWELIVQAYQGGAHRVLGYSSWDDYCTREFGTARIRLPKEDRREVVASLRDSGLSTRAIAAATGLDRKTVMSDLQVGENGPPTEPEHGATLTPVVVDPETGEIIDPATERITGADGKSYLAKDQAAVRARRKRIREMHERGFMTAQIAAEIGSTLEGVGKHLRAMGLKPVASTSKSSVKRTDYEVVEKIVGQLGAVRLAITSTDLSQMADAPNRDEWLNEVEESMKAIRGLRAALKEDA